MFVYMYRDVLGWIIVKENKMVEKLTLSNSLSLSLPLTPRPLLAQILLFFLFTEYLFVFVSTICTLKRELNEIHSLIYWRVAILENIFETFLLEIIVWM